MTSSRQRSTEIKARRADKRTADKLAKAQSERTKFIKSFAVKGIGQAPVNTLNLGRNVSYGWPDYVTRGFYLDEPFTCKDCSKQELWTATQQKWWYETAKGDLRTKATRCRPCRQRENKRKTEARKVHLDGMAKKARPTG